MVRVILNVSGRYFRTVLKIMLIHMFHVFSPFFDRVVDFQVLAKVKHSYSPSQRKGKKCAGMYFSTLSAW